MIACQLKPARAVPIGLGILSAGLILTGWLMGRTDESAHPLTGGSQTAEPSASLREILAHPDVIPSHRHPLLGRRAPDFTLTDADGQLHTLREIQDGHPLVLVFTFGLGCKNCRRELVALDRHLPLLTELDARVVAIGPDSPEEAQAHLGPNDHFGFPVLSDPGNRTALAYRVCRGNDPRHGTFVIDRQGFIAWANVGDSPFNRVTALLTQVAAIEGQLGR